MQKRVLGLDIGIGSVGWAVVNLEEEILDPKEKKAKYKIREGQIVACGVRVFDEPIDDKGKSLAEIRGESRRSRTTIENKGMRLKHLISMAKQYGIVDDAFGVDEFRVPKGISYKDWDVWKLRANAVHKKLSAFELFRVLYHIANHRGFYFPTKAELNSSISSSKENIENKRQKENEKAKSGIKEIKKGFRESGYKTVGEYIYRRGDKKHNKKDDYSVSLYRTDLCDEVKAILEFQRNQGNELFSKEFEDRYINEVLMYTHPIDDDAITKMIGTCEFERGELRFPKQGYAAELFAFYNRLNNLKLSDGSEIDKEKRQKILDFVQNRQATMTFSNLRDVLLLQDYDVHFNLCSYREYNPEYEKTITLKREKLEETKKDIFNLYDENGEIVLNCWDGVKERAIKYFEKYVDKKDIKFYFADIRKELHIKDNLRFCKIKNDYCLSKEEIGIKKYIAQFEKDTFVTFPGYWLIKKGLNNDFDKLKDDEDKLNDIAEALVYCQSDDSRKNYLKDRKFDDELIEKILELNMKGICSFSRKALAKLNEEMKQGKLFNEAKKNCKTDEGCLYGHEEIKKKDVIPEYHGNFEKNPFVARIIAEFRKTVNAINKKYGVIDEIHIELATDVANSKKKIARIRNGQVRYKEQRDKARERCIENGINPDEGDNLLRFRLAEEQDFQCIYSETPIYLGSRENTPVDQVNILDCDIDHIIPISRSFNDSLANKVICTQKANREKVNHIPYEWFKESKTSEEWQSFKVRVLKSNGMIGAKKRNLLRESFSEDDMKNFISRDLNNTRYATRHIAEYLRKYFSFEQSENDAILPENRIRVLGGGITSKLRHMWGLDKNRDENDKHHAQDAIVIACASFGHIYYICSILKKLEEMGTRPGKQQMLPWKSFRDDVAKHLDKVIVSRMVRAKASGQAHKQPKKGEKVYELIKRANAQNIINVQLDTMFRYDIYHGQNGYYCVPIYVIDLHKKDFKHIVKPLNKDGSGREAVAEEFVFSLYKGSYVEMKLNTGEEYKGYVSQFNAQSGQFYITSINGDRSYEINTKTLEIGDFVRVVAENGEICDMMVCEYDENEPTLKLISERKCLSVSANEKKSKKGTESENSKDKISKKYVAEKPLIKLDKEKKITLSSLQSLKKYEIDRLGNRTLIKKETERFGNRMKSNHQRYLEKKQRCQKSTEKEN